MFVVLNEMHQHLSGDRESLTAADTGVSIPHAK
jgi:hypothetical protein